VDAETFESLYRRLNRRELVHPDPLEFLYRYDAAADREIAGLISSSLAYGRVKQILRSVGEVLDRMGPSPSGFLMESSPESLRESLLGFKHRFTTGEDLARMLCGAREVVRSHGSLGACFAALVRKDDDNVVPALTAFARRILTASEGGACPLPDPGKGSACKRLHLYLRWMVRHDEVDPGGWDSVPASKLVVPLDTHMHRLSRRLGLTDRRQADLRTALEITSGFRRFRPDDPVRYDFALTRLGIRSDVDEEALLLTPPGRPR
jgi:uncharacterized protein (TIGR02757 family)